MSDRPTPETDEATLTEQFLVRDLPLSVVAAASQRFERELNAANKALHQKYIEFDALFNEAEQIRIERDEALAANAELLERLRERTESHLAASARDVQTIQRQAVMMERLAKLLSRLKTKDWFTSGDTGEVIVALNAGEVRSALKTYELLKGEQP